LRRARAKTGTEARYIEICMGILQKGERV